MDRKDKSFAIGYVGMGQKPQTKTAELVEVTDTPKGKRGIELLEPGSRIFTMGQCTVFLSPPVNEAYGWHLSISHPTRYPGWDEVAKARYALLPNDRDFVMVLPKPDDYISIHPNCFQVWEDGKLRS